MIKDIFEDEDMVRRIQDRLPYLFQLAEIDNSVGNKLLMEVGSARERILIAMLIYKYGKKNVETRVPRDKKEADVILFGQPVSIKTLTNKYLVGFKLIWTVDAQKAREFQENYKPEADILLVQINWNATGGMYLFTKETQTDVLRSLGYDGYFVLPKAGTNPRGVEISNEAVRSLEKCSDNTKIDINWVKNLDIKYDPYEKWVEHWEKDDVN